MYALAEAMTPERVHTIARVAYRELVEAGTLTVGEFHYLHHQADGTPYDDRTAMADALVAAAKAEGMRISLLRAIYLRGGPGRAPEGAQRRFCDPTWERALEDVATLQKRYAGDPDVRIGIAPHSVRAVPPASLAPIAAYAAREGLPLHMHVAEQPGEIETCVAETGRRPLELLADHGVLGPRFVAVHATHLLAHEARLLGEAGAAACIAPTTERDLGDGHPDLSSLRASGVRLCMGIDSHVVTDPFEEMRGVELGERLRTLRRITDRTETPTLAERLWHAASIEGARAVGFDDAGGVVVLDRDATALELVDDATLLDAIVFSAGLRAVRGVERSLRHRDHFFFEAEHFMLHMRSLGAQPHPPPLAGFGGGGVAGGSALPGGGSFAPAGLGPPFGRGPGTIGFAAIEAVALGEVAVGSTAVLVGGAVAADGASVAVAVADPPVGAAGGGGGGFPFSTIAPAMRSAERTTAPPTKSPVLLFCGGGIVAEEVPGAERSGAPSIGAPRTGAPKTGAESAGTAPEGCSAAARARAPRSMSPESSVGLAGCEPLAEAEPDGRCAVDALARAFSEKSTDCSFRAPVRLSPPPPPDIIGGEDWRTTSSRPAEEAPPKRSTPFAFDSRRAAVAATGCCTTAGAGTGARSDGGGSGSWSDPAAGGAPWSAEMISWTPARGCQSSIPSAQT